MTALETIDRSALLKRVEDIRDRATDPACAVPYRTLTALQRIADELESDGTNWSRVLEDARIALYWYFDQGFAQVPVHAEVGRLATDITKAVGVQRALTRARELVRSSGAPPETEAIVAILQQMQMSFAPDARMDEDRQDKLTADLRAIINPRREALEHVLGPHMRAL